MGGQDHTNAEPLPLLSHILLHPGHVHDAHNLTGLHALPHRARHRSQALRLPQPELRLSLRLRTTLGRPCYYL